MSTFYLVQMHRGPHGWRTSRTTTSREDANRQARDVCDPAEYDDPCRREEVRVIEVEAESVEEAVRLNNGELIDFTAFRHPVLAVRCTACLQEPGSMCIRPSGHSAPDFHRPRKDASDRLFIAQHGEDAWIERLEPGDQWRVHKTGYRSELTAAGEQTVIPGCERDDPRTGAKQLSLF
jgi:hypothetical protein